MSEDVPPRPKIGRAFLRFSVLASAAVAVWLVTWLAIAGTVGLGTVTLSLIIPTAVVVLLVLVVLRQEQTWVWPVKRMARMLPQIHAGELPIESLGEIDGGLKELAGQVREVLRDLKSQKARLAQIVAEMNQRVANRTDALERTIGSLRQQATKDPLTGLYNRRMLDQFLPDEIERCREQRSNLAVLMIDVDHFKTLNDTLGHATGDQLLRDLSQIIRSSLRDCDAAFRNGGDEFVIVMPECDETGAQKTATRIRSLVASLVKTLRVRQTPAVSIGISTLASSSDASAHTLLEHADQQLYKIKSGRKTIAKAG